MNRIPPRGDGFQTPPPRRRPETPPPVRRGGPAESPLGPDDDFRLDAFNPDAHGPLPFYQDQGHAPMPGDHGRDPMPEDQGPDPMPGILALLERMRAAPIEEPVDIHIEEAVEIPISILHKTPQDPIAMEPIDPNDAYVICTKENPDGKQGKNWGPFYSRETIENLRSYRCVVDPFTRYKITEYKKVSFVNQNLTPQLLRSNSAPGRLQSLS